MRRNIQLLSQIVGIFILIKILVSIICFQWLIIRFNTQRFHLIILNVIRTLVLNFLINQHNYLYVPRKGLKRFKSLKPKLWFVRIRHLWAKSLWSLLMKHDRIFSLKQPAYRVQCAPTKKGQNQRPLTLWPWPARICWKGSATRRSQPMWRSPVPPRRSRSSAGWRRPRRRWTGSWTRSWPPARSSIFWTSPWGRTPLRPRRFWRGGTSSPSPFAFWQTNQSFTFK